VRENAASVGVKRIREVVDEATNRLELEGRRTILFLDEIHRFTRSQQDVLLSRCRAGADYAHRRDDGEPALSPSTPPW
jgi:putative ATPase